MTRTEALALAGRQIDAIYERLLDQNLRRLVTDGVEPAQLADYRAWWAEQLPAWRASLLAQVRVSMDEVCGVAHPAWLDEATFGRIH